ncbi:ribosomal protein L1-like protein [Mycena vulgaris]|nr:ribosomal protein L1-like protein [Mycena vulgaris]
MFICILADAADIGLAKQIELECYMSIDDLKRLDKDKKLVKKLARKYEAFLAAEADPPGSKGASPPPSRTLTPEDLSNKLTEGLCLGVAVDHVQMTEDGVLGNDRLLMNFLISLLKRSWQNIKSLHIKTTMGKPVRLF